MPGRFYVEDGALKDQILNALSVRFSSFDDLIGSIDSEDLTKKVDVPRHKSLLEHLWCVIGARESYARSLTAGQWQGFECSLVEYSLGEFSEKLRSSAEAVVSAAGAIDHWTAEQERLLLELAEHEVMHEGGIIRHMYALEMRIPTSVKWA